MSKNQVEYAGGSTLIVNGWRFDRTAYEDFTQSRQWPGHKPGVTGFVAWEFLDAGRYPQHYSEKEIAHKIEYGIFLLATLQRYGFYVPDKVFANGFHREKDNELIPYCRSRETPAVYLKSNIDEKHRWDYYTIEIKE